MRIRHRFAIRAVSIAQVADGGEDGTGEEETTSTVQQQSKDKTARKKAQRAKRTRCCYYRI